MAWCWLGLIRWLTYPCACNPTATCGNAGEIWLEFGKRAMKLRIASHSLLGDAAEDAWTVFLPLGKV
jgi:hypothetical protein